MVSAGDRENVSDEKRVVQESIRKVEKWVEDHDYKGYEPFDGLSSRLRPLTCGNLLADRLLMQLIRQSPINLRPLLGVKPLVSTKGRGYMASGYLAMLRLTGNAQYATKATQSLEWLMENKSPKFSQYTWANHFDFAGRGGRYCRDESIIVWTSLIGQAFLDAYDLLADGKYLKVVESVCEWILALPREETKSGICLSYHMLNQSSVHNANMLGAAMLARTAAITKNAEALSVARQAMEYSCTRQRPDGSWFYGEEDKYHWIDNFHTGYNLDSLKCYMDHTEDRSFEEHLRRGFRYFIEHFIEASGRPKYYHNRAYPVDIQCASQAIETLAKFSAYDPSSRELGFRVAQWTIENMQSKDGHFYYRQLPWIKVRTPMLHWGQATMYKALTSLLSAMSASQ